MAAIKPATPLPWRVITDGAVFVNGPQGTNNAHSIAKMYALTNRDADAAYIVAAANNYPRLVEALNNLLGVVGRCEGQTRRDQELIYEQENAARALLSELGEA